MRFFYISIGFITMGIGTIGIFIPILPTTPFLLLSLFFFTKSSQRLKNWFLQTKLYKKHLESFDKNRSMTLKNKLYILIPVTLMLLITFILLNNIHTRILIVVVLICKYIYFIFYIKTIKEKSKYLL